jgi:hypothetical protein
MLCRVLCLEGYRAAVPRNLHSGAGVKAFYSRSVYHRNSFATLVKFDLVRIEVSLFLPIGFANVETRADNETSGEIRPAWKGFAFR